MEKEEDKIMTIYQTVILGAEEILKSIENASWSGKLLLRNDAFLENEKYQKMLLDKISFFTPGEEIEETVKNIISLFPPCPQAKGYAGEVVTEFGENEEERVVVESSESVEEMQIFFRRKSRVGSPAKIFLEIHKNPYRIPFELHVIPFPGHDVFPQKKSGIKIGTQESFTYLMFPPEDYLTLAFYEIIKDLELIKDLTWYKEVYEVLCRESVDGRKVWENFNRLVKEYPIPSLEKRLDTLIGYKDYGYMKRRWKSQSRRTMETYPQWKDVIEVLGAFFTPVFEGVLKDEIFLGDWMPELRRYLD